MTDEMRSANEMRPANQITRALSDLGEGPAEARLNQQLRRFQASEPKQRVAKRFGLSVPAWSGLGVAALALTLFFVRSEFPPASFKTAASSPGLQAQVEVPAASPAVEAASSLSPLPVAALSALPVPNAPLENQGRPPLRAQIGERYLSAGDELSASAGERLDFGGAGVIQLKPQSHAKVLELSQDSFGMRLERGKLEAQITKGLGNHFRILASSYEVQVIGTVFSVEWQPKDLKFNVAVTRGQVAVTDLQNGQRTLLSAGQSFSAQGDAAGNHVNKEVPARPGSKAVRELNSNSSPSTAAHESTAPHESVPKSAAAATLAGDESPSRQISRPEWQLLAEAGEYQAAYSAAKGAGIPELRAQGTPSELLLLADSARLSGALDDAKQTLLALRNRYPSHQSASVACFVLGRIAFEQHKDAEALSWLHSYLSEQPKGPLAEGARARMLTVTQRSGTPSTLRVAAEEYLKFHPTGQRAEEARRVLGK